MTDRIFSAALTFMLLAGGTFAIGSALFGFDGPAATAQTPVAVVQLPRVEITGHRNIVVAARGSDQTSPGIATLQ